MSNNQNWSGTRSIMHYIIENPSYNTNESISQWIGNIGSSKDTMLLLVGNKSTSEDLVVKKTINALFDTGIVLTITDEILSTQSLEEIVSGKLFLHIGHIPESIENQQKLKELITSVVISKSVQSNGYKIPTQAKIIVTIDEADIFFKDFLEISTVLFIDSKENILSKFQINSTTPLYQAIESSLDFYSNEIKAIPKPHLDIRTDENKRYLESLIEIGSETSATESGLPILDPYSESYKNIISNYERFKHTYIIANQGFGKSQLIISLIMRDYFLNDCSVVLLDPHGDLADDLLRIIPDKERLVYIDLYFDSSSMPTINLFDSIDNNDEDTIYQVTQLIMSVFKNISSEDKLNGLMENVAENCISVMLREGGGSFWELYQFLGGTGSKDWVKLGKNSPNELEAYFFNYEFENESQTRAAVKRRLSKLIRDPKFSAFMNRDSTFSLEQLVNTEGKIIIFNIASRRMPNSYQYYMKFLVGYLQLIALKRVSIPNKDDRKFTQVYLDEFHLFLDKSKNLEEILTGARKYRMFLTFAHQTLAQIENSNLKEILTTIPTRYFIGNIANKSVEMLNKAINTKLENTENSLPGEFYFKEDSKDPFKIQNTNRFLNGEEDIGDDRLKENTQYQLKNYYKDINPKKSLQPTEDEIIAMIEEFKEDFKLVLSSQKNIESSCLINIGNNSEKLKEIKSDISYFDTNKNALRPRIRQQEISTIFQLAFGLNDTISNRKFISQLKSENVDDMFNQADSGTRSAEFTNNGKTQTEQYYYLEW